MNYFTYATNCSVTSVPYRLMRLINTRSILLINICLLSLRREPSTFKQPYRHTILVPRIEQWVPYPVSRDTFLTNDDAALIIAYDLSSPSMKRAIERQSVRSLISVLFFKWSNGSAIKRKRVKSSSGPSNAERIGIDRSRCWIHCFGSVHGKN